MDYMSKSQEKFPRFESNLKDSNLTAALRKRVYSKLNQIEKREKELILKAVLLPLIYLCIYFFSMTSSNYVTFLFGYSCMGFMLVIIFLNLIHEVCHENLFPKKSFNHWYMMIFDMMGANSYMWQKRHIIFHHNFPNVAGWDSDIEKSKFLKVHPDEKGKWLTKYQHFIIFLYPFFLLNWFLVRDFRDYFIQFTGKGKFGPIPFREYIKLLSFKILFVGYVFVIPIYYTPFSIFQVILAGLMMFLVAGIFALFVLLPPHVNINNQFPMVGIKHTLPNSWLKHQLLTTNDLLEQNWFTRYAMANFNFHIAHHLFPNVSYLYAQEVTAEIEKFCLEQGLGYKSISIWKSLRDHYRLIKSNRVETPIWEENM
ncbi:fatty acid desaturase [Aquiflexum sp. TKW24L]|uniref:fatty acid desaturase family protein n=1 Tax=Aquiflexum sp. TKW24L TaxID=2942212 RepID=UPI0032DE394A